MNKPQSKWDQLFASVSDDVVGWRRQHKKATLTEIEDSIDAKLAKLRAQMLEDVIAESELSDVRQVAKEKRPNCPQCGELMQANGKQTREVKTDHEQTVAINRSQVKCGQCGHSFFPSGQ